MACSLARGRIWTIHLNPLQFYATLELIIAVTAACSRCPVLLRPRAVYIGLGGTVVLGMGFGTVLRLILSALVLAVPTLAMGGTLPAAARAAETDEDKARRNMALLYGVNTLGAVTGCMLATFFFLEIFGTHRTLYLASLVNILVAMVARSLARGMAVPQEAPAPTGGGTEEASAPVGFTLTAAGIVGFAFLLMELVWYRMLGPLLGGTVFTFGLILAVALLGIGIGGTLYAVFRQGRPATLSGFAGTSPCWRPSPSRSRWPSGTGSPSLRCS